MLTIINEWLVFGHVRFWVNAFLIHIYTSQQFQIIFKYMNTWNFKLVTKQPLHILIVHGVRMRMPNMIF
jgi:hypothetical protein